MSVIVSEAKRVGRYIKNQVRALEKGIKEGKAKGDFADNPQRIRDVLSYLPIHDILSLHFAISEAWVHGLLVEGYNEEAKQLRDSAIEYATVLKAMIDSFIAEMQEAEEW